MTSLRKGGALIEYDDEDPEFRQEFFEQCKKNGINCHMPPIYIR